MLNAFIKVNLLSGGGGGGEHQVESRREQIIAQINRFQEGQLRLTFELFANDTLKFHSGIYPQPQSVIQVSQTAATTASLLHHQQERNHTGDKSNFREIGVMLRRIGEEFEQRPHRMRRRRCSTQSILASSLVFLLLNSLVSASVAWLVGQPAL